MKILKVYDSFMEELIHDFFRWCVDEGTDIGFIVVPASVVLDLEDSTEE